MRLTFGINDHVYVIEASRATIARSGELDTEPPAILDVSRAETQIRPQWDHDGPRPTAPDVTHRHSQCGADITHRDEHHRQSVCVRASGHSGAHDDGQGCTWTSGGVG